MMTEAAFLCVVSDDGVINRSLITPFCVLTLGVNVPIMHDVPRE